LRFPAQSSTASSVACRRKRQRTGAVQDAARRSWRHRRRASVLDCGGPPPLFLLPATRFRLPFSFHCAQRCSMPEPRTPWPHAPTHQLSVRGTYFVTASTYQQAHHFRGPRRLRVLHRGLLTVAARFAWQLEAWAVFSNHYHFIAHSPPGATDAASLRAMLSVLHVKTAGWVNKLDHVEGRQVWFNFRDTRLTRQPSYLARLNYVHQNAVKHGLVPVACQYPWCSAAWFERTASPAMVKSIYRFKTDRIATADDDIRPDADW
jgi:REP-associated tyrosine transposase